MQACGRWVASSVFSDDLGAVSLCWTSAGMVVSSVLRTLVMVRRHASDGMVDDRSRGCLCRSPVANFVGGETGGSMLALACGDVGDVSGGSGNSGGFVFRHLRQRRSRWLCC